jgi:hypothetical protein
LKEDKSFFEQRWHLAGLADEGWKRKYTFPVATLKRLFSPLLKLYNPYTGFRARKDT